MSVIKLARSERKFYEPIHRETLQDERMSWEAQGLLTYMLSRNDDWEFHARELAGRRKGGVDRIRKLLRELEELGYIRSVQVRDSKGRMSTVERTVYEKAFMWETPDETGTVFSVHGKTVHGKTGHGKQGTKEYIFSNKTDKTENRLNTVAKIAPSSRSNPEVLGLLQLLNDRVEQNGFKRFTEGAHAYDAMSRLMSLDNRTYEQIEFIIDWSQSDEFWLGNIRSPAKLRTHFDAMLAKALRRTGMHAANNFINTPEEAF